MIVQGKLEEAISQCKKVLQINPRFTAAYYHLAFALAKLGKFNESIEQYQKITRLDPDKSVDVYNQIGKIQVHLGKLDEAVETFQKAIDVNSASEFREVIADVHFNLGYVLKRQGKPEESNRELRKAIQGYRKELSENPKSSESHTVLAKALVEIGDYEEATEHFRQAVALGPTDLTKRMNLIKVLEGQGRLSEAIEATHQAIQFMSSDNQRGAVIMLERYLENLRTRPSQDNYSERQR